MPAPTQDSSALHLSLGLVVLLGCLAAPVSAEVALVESRGHLLQINLETGRGFSLGELETEGRFEGMTAGPDGKLYGVASTQPDYALYVVDPETVEATLIGTFTLGEEPSTLTFDSSGRLWMGAGSGLYEVDLETGDVMLRHTLERTIRGLASREGELFAITNDSLLERLDVQSGSLETLFELDLPSALTAASFDALGRLRVAMIGGGILSQISLYYYVVDVEAQVVTATYDEGYHFTRLEAGALSLAMGAAPVVEVPALGGAGAILLVVVMAVAGLLHLRRGG